MKYCQDFGDALRAARTRADKSQADVAKFLGVSLSYVSDVERGSRTPLTRERVVEVARFLDVDVAVLLLARGAWAREIGLPVLGGPQDSVAARLSARWESLAPEALARIGREVGL